MEIHYTLNQEDAAAFLKRGQKQLSRWIVLLMVPLVAGMVVAPDLIRILKRGTGIPLGTLLTFVGPMAAFGIFYAFFSWYNPRAQTAKLATHPYFIGEHTARLSEEAFHHTNEGGGDFTRWRIIKEIVDSPEHIFVLVTAGQGHVIPKRAFATPAEAEQFLVRAQELQRKATSTEPIASPMR